MNPGERRRPLSPPGIFVHPVAGIAFLAVTVALVVTVSSPGAAVDVALFLLAFSMKVAAVIVTAWDRRSRGLSAVWWTLGVVVLDAPVYVVYTVLRRRQAAGRTEGATVESRSSGRRPPVAIALLGLGFILVAIVAASPVTFPLLIGALLIGAWAAARGRRRPGFALLAAAIVVPAVVAGYSVGSIKAYRIPSSGMAPALAVGDRVIAEQNGDYHPRRNEIVVFHPPAGALGSPMCGAPVAPRALCSVPTPQVASGITFVKRVAAVPGDTVAFRHGHLVLNGTVQSDPSAVPCGSGPACSFRPRITIPAGEYFMLGDNRGNSDDSRFYGPVPSSSILGPVVLIYWPSARAGSP